MWESTERPCEGYRTPSSLAGADKKSRVLLALSGGADSRALLQLLYQSSQCDGFELILAHVNHGIRGEEALRDRDFCISLANSYGLEICVLDADVPALAKAHGRGLEEEAREVRYAYFAKLMRERGIHLLATAHHADDNLETLLFRLCRGTGLRGLSAIAPTRAVEGGILVRPMLHCTRREILAFCEAHSLQYVSDSTNKDTAYARNRIRAEVIPVLESLFDGLAPRVTDMTEELREDEACLQKFAKDFLKQYEPTEALPIDALKQLPVPILRRALRLWVKEHTAGELERTHIDALTEVITGMGERAVRVSLPDGVCAVREFDRLRLSARELPPTDFCFPLTLGTRVLEESGIVIRVEKAEDDIKIHNLSTQSCISYYSEFDIIDKDLHWRSRREGDVILQGGMHRKLRKLCNAKRIPVRLRDRLPILCDGEGIVWAPFVGARDGLKETGNRYFISVRLPDAEER